MRTIVIGLALLAVVRAGDAEAQCAPAAWSFAPQESSPVPPSPPDPSLRPAVPGCLQGLSAPNQESCTPAEIADYAAAIEAYEDALQRYIAAADAFANASIRFANDAIARAEATGDFADAVFDFATCEAESLRNAGR